MKVAKTMKVEIEHGTIWIEWDSSTPTDISLSVDGGERTTLVSRDTLTRLGEACTRALAEIEEGKKVVGSTPKRSTPHGT